MIKFLIKNGEQELVISNNVLEYFDKYKQVGPNSKEVGGQIFAKIYLNKVILEQVTGPSKFDRSSRISFIPNKIIERSTIKKMFMNGLHYVGDWHTHPESIPTPSNIDKNTICSIFNNSTHELAGLLMIIVGQKSGLDGLYIGIQDKNGLHEIEVN